MARKRVLVLAILLLVLLPLYFSSFEVNAAQAIGLTSVTLYSIADAYVNASSPETNYGNLAIMNVSANSEQDFTYVKFDLTSLPSGANVISANLSVYLSSTGGDLYAMPADTIGAYYCPDNSWAENGISWSNKPSFNPNPTGSWGFGIVYTEDKYKVWDVTADVSTAGPSGIITEVLKFQIKTGDGYAVFQSREGANRPKLEVEYSTEPNPSPSLSPSPTSTPWASPTASPTPSPAPSPSPSPTASPSPSPLASPSTSPSPSPSTQGLILPREVIYAAVGAIIIVIIAVAAVVLKKRQNRISKAPTPPPPSPPFQLSTDIKSYAAATTFF